MKQLVCEMCGSTNLMKQDGVYVCHYCGTKYSPEEAKKMLVEIDNSEKLNNYYILARRAKENSNLNDGEKYYDLIRQEAPNDWEANFYAVYFRALNCRIGEIASAANSVSNCIPTVFSLIYQYVSDDKEKEKAVDDVCSHAFLISDIFSGAANKHYDEIGESIRAKYIGENINNISEAGNIIKVTCDSICDYCDDNAILTAGIPYLKKRISQGLYDPSRYISTVQKLEPSYQGRIVSSEEINNIISSAMKQTQSNNQAQSSGCYVATAVYGSYDCPQVWTLRRYRDYTLAETWYGRAFIRAYYAISPTLVKWFGNKEWFKRMWRGKLDCMVEQLKAEGISDTPYEDRQW